MHLICTDSGDVREVHSQKLEDALNDLAEREGAQVIVLGSTHRGALGRVYPGSVGERLLNGAPCAVAVAPRGYARSEQDGFEIIGVAYDGSEESKLALQTGERLARKLDGAVRLVVAVPPPPPSVSRMMGAMGADPGFTRLLREPGEKALEEGLSSVGDIEVQSELKLGDPAQVLADESGDLDLLVIGSRGYGPLRRTLVGSVSAEVMRKSPCPVMVIPRAGGLGVD